MVIIEGMECNLVMGMAGRVTYQVPIVGIVAGRLGMEDRVDGMTGRVSQL